MIVPVKADLSSILTNDYACEVQIIASAEENILSVLKHPTEEGVYLVGTNGELRNVSDDNEDVLANQGTDTNGNPTRYKLTF